MSVIIRMLLGRERCLQVMDIPKCLRELADTNEDGLNNLRLMKGIHAIVFTYDIRTNKIRRVFIEKHLRSAYEWASHVNIHKHRYPKYHVMFMLNRDVGFMATSFTHLGPMTRWMLVHGCRHSKNSVSRHNYDHTKLCVDGYNLCHIKITGKSSDHGTCHICREYRKEWMGDIIDLSHHNRAKALSICKCEWCTVSNKQDFVYREFRLLSC